MGLDSIVFGLIEGIFQLIIDLANLEIFSQSTINEFASRIYIILGLLMLFKITISFVQMLIDPDKMDDKEQGMGNILKRVIISLALIFLVPSIFSLARDLQNRVLPIIPKVILGVTVDPDTEDESIEATMSSLGQTMAFYSFLPFFNYDNNTCDDGSILGTGTYLSNSGASGAPVIYSVPTAWVHVNDKNSCSTNKDQYKYNYRWLVSTFVGVYLIFTLVGVAVEIAIRAIKFSICEVIAPIPIASYIDPKTSKQAFDNWVSTSVKTYLDLFLNLIIVYFVVYVFLAVFKVDNLATIYSKLGTNPLRYTFVTLFIIIGLCHFVKQAPKFFTDLLGIKGGDGISKIFKDAAGVFGTAGAVGTVGYRGARDAYKMSQENAESNGLSRGRAVMGAAGASGRVLINRLRGKGVRESATSAIDAVHSKTSSSIKRTSGYAKNGRADFSSFIEGVQKQREANIRNRQGLPSSKASMDASIENIESLSKAWSDAEGLTSSHKLIKYYTAAYDAAKSSGVESYVDQDRLKELRRNLVAAQNSGDLATAARIGSEIDDVMQKARDAQSNQINRAQKNLSDAKRRLILASAAHDLSIFTDEDREIMKNNGLTENGELNADKVFTDGSVGQIQSNLRNFSAVINAKRQSDGRLNAFLQSQNGKFVDAQGNFDIETFLDSHRNSDGIIDSEIMSDLKKFMVDTAPEYTAKEIRNTPEYAQASVTEPNNNSGGKS